MSEIKVISVRLNEEELEWVKEYGEAEDLTVSQIIRRALKAYKKDKVDKED